MIQSTIKARAGVAGASLRGRSLIKVLAAVVGTTLLTGSAFAQISSFTTDDSTTLIGGYTTRGNIRLDNPAPAGGASVDVTSSNPAKAYAASPVLVAEGTRNKPFNILTQTVLVETPVTISVTYNGDTKSTDLILLPGGLTDAECDATLCSGEIGEGEAWLSGPQETDVTVDLLSFNPAVASVPASTVVPAGQRFGGFFDITAGVVAVSTSATIRARLVNSIRLCTVTVSPFAASLTVEVRKNSGALVNNAGVTIVYEDGTTFTGKTKSGVVTFGPTIPNGNANVYVRMPGSGLVSGPFAVTIGGCEPTHLALVLSNS